MQRRSNCWDCNSMKVSNLKEMLMNFFWGCEVRSKTELERKVEADTIKIACAENFLILEECSDRAYRYRITPRGKSYRDEPKK